MKTPDLHDQFLNCLKSRFSSAEIKSQIVHTLGVTPDAAYRRTSGQVLFTPREIGILSRKLGISLDRLLYKSSGEVVWMPFILEFPLHARSMDSLYGIIDYYLKRIEAIVSLAGSPSELGSIYNNLPLEFYIHCPVLTKFMFFSWGHNFMGSEEFDDYSQWQLPENVSALSERIKAVYRFDRAYYIWDSALVWSLVRRVRELHRMRVIDTPGKEEIREAVSHMLSDLEKTLNGTHASQIGLLPDMEFYVSNINLGFTNNSYSAGEKHLVTFQTNFSFCGIEDNPESFRKMKDWMDSFKRVSVQLSTAGRSERKLFFDNQHKIIEQFLG